MRDATINGFIPVQEAAKKWNITNHRVQILCKEGRIKGAMKLSRILVIPKNAEKPTNGRQVPHMGKGCNHASNDNV